MIFPMSQWGSRLHPRIALGLLHPGGDSAQLARAKQAPHLLPLPPCTGAGLGRRVAVLHPGHPCLPPGRALSSASLQDERFKAHDLLEHRRLLWHGTNVAVVAAILKSGLRIMPHSGGRVGKGIYFASENSKSACYGEGPGLGRAARDAHRVCVSLAAFAYPLPGSCGHAKPPPCHGNWSLCRSVASAQLDGNTRDGAIIPIPFSHGSGLYI